MEGLVEGGVCPRREDLLEPAEGDPLPSTPRLGDPTRAEGVLRSWSRATCLITAIFVVKIQATHSPGLGTEVSLTLERLTSKSSRSGQDLSPSPSKSH